MRQNMKRNILEGTSLREVDAVRLVAECLESMEDTVCGKSRVEVIITVRRVLQAGVAALRAAEHTVPFEQAAWKSVEIRSDRRPTTTRDLRNYVRRILRVKDVASLPLRSMTTAQCRGILKAAFGNSTSSYRKGRAILHSIFAYGMRQEWCDTNPITRIEVPRVQEKRIEPLQMSEVQRLKKTVEREIFKDMRFSLCMLLYAGVRPAEVSRLQPEDVCWSEKQVIIRSQTSKTGGGRVVKLRLLPGMSRNDCVVPSNWSKRWRALRRSAGFRQWVPDVCRHTFACYHAAYYRNLPELQLEMGHRDAGLLRTRYVVPTRHGSASAFWRLSCS